MAEGAAVKDVPKNSCCSALEDKYEKLQQRYAKSEDGRRNLRRGVEIFEQQLAKMQTENQNLKKAYEEERVRAENEREEKVKESGMRDDLEDEISALKSDILSLQQKRGSGVEDVDAEVTLLKARVSEGEAETSRLKDLLEKERKRADTQKKKAEAEEKKAKEACQNAKAEKSRADKENEEKVKELAKRSSLEEEITSLKSQILSLQQKEGSGKQEVDEEIILLRARMSEGEAESSRLKDLLEKERMQADSLKKKAEAEEKKTDEACQNAKVEKSRADKEREEKLRELANRISLEKEISSLKSQVLPLQQKEGAGKQEVNEEITLLRARISEEEAEISRFKELLEKERMRADFEKKKAEAEKKKANEAWKNVKAEKARVDEEKRLASIEAKEAEENRLKLERLIAELDEARSTLVLETAKTEEANKKLAAERQKAIKEKKRADAETAKAKEQRKLAEMNRMKAMEEKSCADHLSQLLEEEKRRIEKLQKQIDELVSSRKMVEVRADLPVKQMNGTEKRKDGLQLKRQTGESKLNLDCLKCEEAKKGLEEGKQKAKREKKRADSEIRKAEEQRKIAEVFREKAVEEKNRADQLAQQLEDHKRRTEELEKEIQELVSSRRLVQPPFVPLDENITTETARTKLLRKQLKFERMQVKHAKEVTKLEKGRNCILQHEVCCLKQEFLQFSHRLKILDSCFSHDEVGIDLTKTGNAYNIQSSNLKRKLLGTEPYHMHLHSENELLNTSDRLKESIEFNVPLLPTLEGNCTESISGIDSKLEPLLRGSNRKMLQSSAINSSLASFSDRPLVGSQERGTISVTESARLTGEKSNPETNISTLPGEVTKVTRNENIAEVAENSVRSPLRIGKKRKRILDAVESIEHLYSEGKKWHLQLSENLAVLHDMLGTKMEKHLDEGRSLVTSQREKINAKQDKSRNKRMAYTEEEVALCHLRNSSEQNDGIGSKGIEEANVYLHASTPAEACKDGIGDSGQDDLGNFEVTDDGYMKLLDLDDSDDERRYRFAMAMPLSPLPEIEFQSIDKFKTDNSKQAAVGCFNDRSSNANENLVRHCGVDVMNLEIESNNYKHNTYGTTNVSPLQKEGSVNSFKVLVNDENSRFFPQNAGNACVSPICEASVELGMSDCGDKVPKISCENNLESGCSDLPQYCVVFSHTIDCSSVSNVFCATRTCLAQCPLISEKVCVVQKIMFTLLKVEGLLPREKVCVFFSLMLQNFSWITLENFRNFSVGDSTILDSFAGNMRTAMSDVETRNMFAELCNLDELLALIEDFLVDRKVLMRSDQSSESLLDSDPIANIALNGGDIILSVQRASTNQLVAAAIIVASLCAAIDRIGFICEASFNIFRMQEIDSSLLTVLHAFAYICGSKYFTLDDYRLIMTVIKSLITFLEGANLSANSGSVLPSLALVRPDFPPCTNCPFFEGAIFMEVVVSVLLEKLENYGLSEISQVDMTESLNLLNSEALFHKDETGPSSDLTLFGKPTSWSNIVFDGSLCELGDILSLLELVACKMSWDWTCNNIVQQLLKMLESRVLENLLAAIIILLGQLGRLGVATKGYEDTGVKNIRDRLSEFLCQSTSRKAGLAIQIATVTALLGVISLSFEELVKKSNLELPALVVSHSIPAAADCISKWFSSLNKEQQSLSLSLLSAVTPG